MSNKTRLISGRVPLANTANLSTNRYQFLGLDSAEPNLGAGSNNQILSYTTQGTGRQWVSIENTTTGIVATQAYAKANSANVLAQAAFDVANTAAAINIDEFARTTANSASSNTIYTQGVDATQNTNITNVDVKAQAAFDKANTASSADQFARDTANASVLLQSGINLTQNNSIINVDVKAQAAFDKANTAGADQYARDTANNASNNITILQGVNTTQNTNITSINAKAQAAFDVANTAAAVNIDQYARDTANATVLLQSGINATQNTNTTNTDNKAQAAFNQANTSLSSITVIQGVNAGQNTLINTTQSNIQIAYNQANTALSTAAAAFAASNTNLISIGTINGINAGQDINITYATGLAQAAFNKANTPSVDTFARNTANDGIILAQAAFNKANTADARAVTSGDYANSAYLHASAAFAAANNASGGSGGGTQLTSIIDSFSGDNSTTTFTLSTTPASANQTFAFLNGVYQQKNTYSVSNSSIIFSEAATSNDTIEVITFSGTGTSSTQGSAGYKVRVYTGTGACTSFTISSSHSANSVLVFENGICQEPIADYTVSGTLLTFVTAPSNGIKIQIRELPV